MAAWSLWGINMGKKKNTIKATPAPEPGAEDLAVLHPDQTLTIAGRELTLREYRFVEGLRLLPLYEPFLEDLYGSLKDGEQVPQLHHLVQIMGQHHAQILELIALSAQVEQDWIEQLDDTEGTQLLYAWWTVNVGFFMRRISSRLLVNRLIADSPDAGG